MRATARNKRIAQPSSALAAVLSWLGLGEAASWRLLILLALATGSGLAVIYLTHRDRLLFNELQVLREEANELDVEWGQLLIEQSALGVGGRVEQRATDDLEMRVPDIEDIVMVGNEQAE